jgi:hypothetical protein
LVGLGIKTNNDEIHLKATMPKMANELQEKLEEAKKTKPKVGTTITFPRRY